RSYTAELVAFHREEKVIELVLNGKPFRVSLQDKYDELLRSLGMENTGSARAGQVKAPMPGMVLDILVSEGQEVEKDTPLVILEAMKMENVIKSPAAGKVKSIPAVKSKPVEKNSILIEFH
ncbi:MAG: acetyl-CoA carboxylase biotin carboxyl carrier protein subunit, partial [Flavobacteriales bacterium]|nr:acetyl-CoA carboxylase biotin carboxyl carrier protein subunit [Flavobacteriales bacterium]